jgi:hypothetical protein
LFTFPPTGTVSQRQHQEIGKMWKFFTPAALCLAVGIAPAAAAHVGEYDSIHKVGVISAIGDTFAFDRIGVMVFGNGQQTASVADWHLDEVATKLISDALSSRFTVKPVNIDSHSICSAKNFCLPISQNPDVDAYVVLVAAGMLDPYSTAITIQGVGLWSQEGLLVSDHDWVHVNTKIYVVDARTGNRIDDGSGMLPSQGFWGASYPIAPFPISDWANPPVPPSAEAMDKVHSTVLDLLNKSLPEALARAGLVTN